MTRKTIPLNKTNSDFFTECTLVGLSTKDYFSSVVIFIKSSDFNIGYEIEIKTPYSITNMGKFIGVGDPRFITISSFEITQNNLEIRTFSGETLTFNLENIQNQIIITEINYIN
jgi:hypothetical protein